MTSFHFRAAEYHHRQKSTDWYWTVSIIAVATAATAIIFSNILLAILIILATFSLLTYAARLPEDRDIQISDAGITIGKYLFSYANLESFWIEHDEYPRMLIKTKRFFMPHIIIPVTSLDEDGRDELREFLRTKIFEQEQSEPLLELIMERLGF